MLFMHTFNMVNNYFGSADRLQGVLLRMKVDTSTYSDSNR